MAITEINTGRCYLCGKRKVTFLIVRIMQPSYPHYVCDECKKEKVDGMNGYMVVKKVKD